VTLIFIKLSAHIIICVLHIRIFEYKAYANYESSTLLFLILLLILIHIINCNPTLLPPTKEAVNAFARVCLSVCLLARLLINAWMDLDEILRVDRRRDMDELINFSARSGS